LKEKVTPEGEAGREREKSTEDPSLLMRGRNLTYPPKVQASPEGSSSKKGENTLKGIAVANVPTH